MKSAIYKKYITERNLNYLLIFIGAIFLLAELKRVSDFGIFLQASEDIHLEKNIYQIWYGVGFRYYYSPLFALFLTPLTYLPPYLAATFWSALGMILFIRTVYLLHQFTPGIDRSGRFNFLLVLCGLTVVYANFHNNQMSAFLLWTMIESLVQIKKGRWITGSALLALGINIKLLPLVIVPYLIYRANYKAAVAALFWMVVFWVLPSVFIGWDFNLSLLKSYWNYINPTLKQNVIDIDEPGLLSLSSLITTWFTDQFSLNELGYRRHFFVLPNQTIGIIILVVRLGFVFLTLHFLKWPPFKKAVSKEHQLWEISYLCLVTPLIFPHQQNYGFFLIIPTIFFVLYRFKSHENGEKSWVHWLFILGIILINTELLLGAYKMVFWNYKVLTYGVLIMVFILVLLDPVKRKAKT
jgi:hypothetical protein